MPPPIEDLLPRIAAADTHAVTLLYKEVSARLFGIQLRILKNQELAEEALQETFVKVWNNAASYDATKSTANVWLNSLARNQALDILRRQRTRSAIDVRLPDLDADRWQHLSRAFPDTYADNEILSLCLKRLEQDAQQCIVGVYCEGFTHVEMSERLNRSLGTVKSWIRRSLSNLRDCLHEHA